MGTVPVETARRRSRDSAYGQEAAFQRTRGGQVLGVALELTVATLPLLIALSGEG